MWNTHFQSLYQRNADLRTAFRFLSRFRHLWHKAAAAAFFGALSSGLQLLVPLSAAVIINSALPQKNFQLLAWIAGGLAVAALLSLLFAYGEFHFSANLRERISLELRRDLFVHLQHLPFRYFKNHDSGYVMSRIAQDPDSAIEFPAGLTTLGRSLTWFLAAFVLVPVLHPMIGLVVIVSIPLYVVVMVIFNRRIRDQFAVVQERTAKSSRELFESLGGIYETKSYGGEGFRARRYVRSLARRARSLIRGRRLMALGGHSTQVLLLLISLFILVYGGAEVMRGNLTLGELVALNAISAYLLTPVNALVKKGFDMQRSVAAIERLNEVLGSPVEGSGNGSLKPAEVAGRVEYKGVRFAYEPNRPVLRDVSFEILPGQTVLFVGPSGQGKSTLMALLPHFFADYQGSIELDGVPTRDMDLAWLRGQIAYVSQDIFLFSDSVINNLRLGHPRASEEDIRAAARQANALDFIEALPDGFETTVGERGCRLSGGQRQRIAMARAILKDAPILILDEATSAVDMETESAVYQALNRLMQGRTTLVVAHHAEAFAHHFDSIWEVKDGTVTERPLWALKQPLDVAHG